MKISLEWLKDYVALPGSPDALSELLTNGGTEVIGREHRGNVPDKVVVAQILSSEQHPNADRLSVCQVDDGSGQPRQIVCGAKNYKVGDKVPLALPGAVLGPDFKIKAGKLRGVTSDGMMCSAKELALAEDAEGLLILPADAPVGKPAKELFPPDTMLELEVTPNRPDMLGYQGVAREVAALTQVEAKIADAAAVARKAADGVVRLEVLFTPHGSSAG
jgi:phenylalanyl-tRNA synthetase beta chain